MEIELFICVLMADTINRPNDGRRHKLVMVDKIINIIIFNAWNINIIIFNAWNINKTYKCHMLYYQCSPNLYKCSPKVLPTF